MIQPKRPAAKPARKHARTPDHRPAPKRGPAPAKVAVAKAPGVKAPAAKAPLRRPRTLDSGDRLQKILEDANIKLASVATDVMGVSGRRILQALLAGVADPEQLAELAKGRLRTKKTELQAALHGRLRPHHTRLLTHILTHLEFLEETIASCEAEVEELCQPFAQEIALLDTAPGISTRTAQDLIAETGVAM